ncbi:Phospholipase A2-like domain [Popillia japonica]|uniref:Phospholipase A2-like domain n=1 Tax=Popillia japonica TaxID=7064 RepID=A0AAW1JBH5_POPJA
MPEFLYPGHNYLGPGNVLDHGEPVDNADEIAREHDFAYSVARREEDIYRADWQAIKQFGGDFVSTGNVADVVGIVGLGAKTIVERPLGTVFYGMPVLVMLLT